MPLCPSSRRESPERAKVTLETPLACAWLGQCSNSPHSQPRAPSPTQSSPLRNALGCGVSTAMAVPWVVS